MCLCVSVSAQDEKQEKGFLAGDTMFNLAGSGSSDEDVDNTIFGMEMSLGHFLTDCLAGEIRQGFNIVDVPGNDDDWSASTRGALDLYFNLGCLWPFVGANIGYVYGDAVSDTWVAGPEAGLKCFVNTTTYLFGMVEYQFYFDDSDEVDDAFDDGRFVYSLGIGFKF
jgi:hypothetical protein